MVWSNIHFLFVMRLGNFNFKVSLEVSEPVKCAGFRIGLSYKFVFLYFQSKRDSFFTAARNSRVQP